jgi:hypothetical protein
VLHLQETASELADQLFISSRFTSEDSIRNSINTQSARQRKSIESVDGVLPDLTWPLMCVSIMFTKDSLQCLRSGALNKRCNETKDVLEVLHEFHHGCLFEFAK